MNESPRLLEVVRRVSRERRLSRKTESAYVNHIRRFQEFHAERDLTEIGEGGVNEFLNHLQKTENLAASTRNQALSALSFLYRDVLRQGFVTSLKTAKRARAIAKTPVVFTPEEARAVLLQMRGDTYLIAALMYGAGLRLTEAIALRVGDLDFERREIVIRDARTLKRERSTILPETMIDALERHLQQVRYQYEDDLQLGLGRVHLPKALGTESSQAAFDWRWQFVFPSHYLTPNKISDRHHVAESTVQKAVNDAIAKARLRKPAGCQTFRYSFAARLFERNYDIRRVQTLLGHKNLKSTAVYRQLAARTRRVLRSPLDA